MSATTALGIDPGQKTGWAVISSSGIVLGLGSVPASMDAGKKIHELVEGVDGVGPALVVVVQVPALHGEAAPNYRGPERGRGRMVAAAMAKNGVLSGAIYGYWLRLQAEQPRLQVMAVPSADLGAAKVRMKLPDREWRQLYQWTGGRTNEHERDAAQIARYGLWLARSGGRCD